MDNNKCEVIVDLIPLYVDEVCSDESRMWIEQHLKECENCRKLCETMKKEFRMPDSQEQRQEDANIIKKIKKRIWIERVVISMLVVFVTSFLAYHGLFFLLAQQKNMNDVIDLNNISVEQDQEGNLWLLRSGNATMASWTFPDIYTMDGDVVRSYSDSIYKEQDEMEAYQLKVNFYESPLQYYFHKIYEGDTDVGEERSQLVSKEKLERYEQIVIEQTDGTKKILWEKEKK